MPVPDITTLDKMDYGPSPLALVTGATGPLGSLIVLALVKEGFKVRATTRLAARGESWMKKYPEMKGKVEWLEVQDMKVVGSLDDAVPEGCTAVVHCAGPYHWNYATSVEFIVATMNGTMSILKGAAKVPTVKRFIMINSIAAIHSHDYYGESRGSENTYDESFWNVHTAEECLTTQLNWPHYGYVLSKKLAEKAAVEWMEKEQPAFDMVRLHPATGYGSLPQVTDDYTFDDLDAASGRLWTSINHDHVEDNYWPAFTAFEDSCDAVIKALQTPKASGQRYQLISGHYDHDHILTILVYLFPEEQHRFPAPYNTMAQPKTLDLPELRPHFKTDCSKAERELGITQWRTMEDCLKAEMPTLFELAEKDKAF